MKKLTLILMLLAATAIKSEAQLVLSLMQPSPLQLRASDMVHATLVNSGGATKLYFTGSVVNTQNGKKILDCKSSAQDINPGVSTLNETFLQPVYTYFSESFRESGVAPYGNYEICLRAYSAIDNEERGEGCITVEVTPMSPPLLITPENQSTIYEQYPLLTWLAPTPVKNPGSVLYDLKLVELLPNQTAYDAIQRNYGLLELKGLKTTYQQYPMTATKLETGKKYAWFIKARSTDGNLIGETEVWVFELDANEKEALPKKEETYIIIQSLIPAGNINVIHGKKMYLRIKDNLESGKLEVKCKEVGNDKMSKECSKLFIVNGGGNISLEVDMNECTLKKSTTYEAILLINGREFNKVLFKNEN